MMTRSTMPKRRGKLNGLLAAAILSGALGAVPAGAAVIETVKISNSFGFSTQPGASTPIQPGGSVESIFRANSDPAQQSELGIVYTATADSGGFFFLHNNYCVGTCSTFSRTLITFSLTNTGREDAALRFDSQITPGHLARVLRSEGMAASFQFNVRQSTGESVVDLYSASGSATSGGLFLDTGGLKYNGLNRVADQDGLFEVLDWEATNLNLKLDRIAPGATSFVTYEAIYMSDASAICQDIRNCPGVQVVFSDPRNNGGVNAAAALETSFASSFSAMTTPLRPAINTLYGPSFIPASFVPVATPLPPQPGALPPLQYGEAFRPNVLGVPEPSAWLMMISGFGLIGSMARRRKGLQQLTA